MRISDTAASMTDTPSDLLSSEDRALAERANRGDHAALAVLLERHAAVAARAAHAVLGRPDEALDAAQAALLRVACGFESQQWSGGSVQAWVAACAHAAAVDAVRASSSRRRMEERVAGEAAVSGESAPSPEALAEREEVRAVLRQEMARLPDATGQALALHHLHGLPVAQVAGQLGLSVDACKQRLHRGREELRERLVRRGIATAGLALVASGLAALARSADAWAATLDPAALANLAARAAQGAAVGPAIGSEGPPAETAVSPGAKVQRNAPDVSGGATVVSNTTYSSSSGAGAGLLLVLALLVGGACYELLVMTAPVQNSQPLASLPESAGSAPRENMPAAVPAAQVDNSPAADPAAAQPRWQAPRFVVGMNRPVSLASSGPRAVILTLEYEKAPAGKSFNESDRLVPIRSSDGGQSWSMGSAMKGYCGGAVALDGEGRTLLVGMVPSQAQGAEGALFGKVARPGAARMEWRVAGPDGVLGAAKTMASASGNTVFVPEAKLIAAGNATWTFAVRCEAKDGKLTNPAVAVFRGEKDAPPQEIPSQWQGLPGSQPCGWAKDARHAGFFLHREKERQLLHCVTADGGASWKTDVVPLDLQADSDFLFQSMLPVSVSRCGDRLALLAKVLHIKERSLSPKDAFFQTYCLTSEDLGQTWSAPVPASGREGILDMIYGSFSVYAGRDAVYLCHDSMELNVKKDQPAEAFSSDNRVVVLASPTGGKPWLNQHAFDALSGRAAFSLLGGDEAAMHVAFMAMPKGEPALVIRSFAAGAWTKAEGTPEWFKEEVLPEPTAEEF